MFKKFCGSTAAPFVIIIGFMLTMCFCAGLDVKAEGVGRWQSQEEEEQYWKDLKAGKPGYYYSDDMHLFGKDKATKRAASEKLLLRLQERLEAAERRIADLERRLKYQETGNWEPRKQSDDYDYGTIIPAGD